MLVLESSVVLLHCLVHLANSHPSFHVKRSATLNEFIKHHEPAFYDAQQLTNQHKRFKRSGGSSSTYQSGIDPLKLTISTSSRVFKLVLQPDESLFAQDAEFVGIEGKKINFDPRTVYVGTLEDDERTKVRGIITKDGLFDGTITTQLEEFYVEPVSRYKASEELDNSHSIMYKVTDVIHPESPLCAIYNFETKEKPSDLNTIAHRSKRQSESGKKITASFHHKSHPRSSFVKNVYDQAEKKETDKASGWPQFKNLFRPHNQRLEFNSLPPSESPLLALVRPRSISSSADLSGSDGAYYDLDLVNFSLGLNIGGKKNYDEDNNRHYEFNDDRFSTFKPTNGTADTSGNQWRPKSGIIESVYKFTNSTKSSKGYFPASSIIHKSNPKILVGTGTEESHANLIITSDDNLEHHARKRVMVDPKKTTCMLYLQADHLFFEKYGTEETCIEVMTRHVQRVNSIYRNTDFNQDGKPDNISFMIKRIKVHSVKDPSYRFPGNYGVEKFLEIFSEEDYDAFCLAYMFTYRDFEMGTLGLAWTGDLKNAGGVCEKNGHYRGSLKSLNTGIVTVLNYGKHVPSAVSHVTLAHEIGHNFGSPHDPDGCTPGGDDGNFIMFARATSGDKKNNNKFSPCSLHAINPVLSVKARSSKGCFTEPQTSICGNGVVEPGEECDCGWEEDCRDSCCYPQRRYPPLDEIPCRLTPNAICSPSQGPCCTTNCQLKLGDMCRTDNGCRDSSYCNGSSPQCPPSINKPNKTVCNEEFVCYMGECTGSICLAYGLESCQCIPTPSDAATKACELCCKLSGENQPCLSSFHWNQAPYDVPDMFAKPGTPCNDYNGYCDVFRKCREVDPSGPIATLRKLLLSEENIASFKKWAIDQWYYCALFFVSFLLVMIICTKFLSKKPKIKSVTVMHSSPTETVRLPEGGSGPAVVVHPIAVRSKLPFKKKVREKKRRIKASPVGEKPTAHSVNNNNNSPVEAKKKTKKRVDAKPTAIAVKSSKGVKKDTIVVATSNTAAAVKSSIAEREDPLGKVRNWLIQSHNIDSFGSLKKSKSSPAGFDLSDPCAAKKRHGRPALATTSPTTAKSSNMNTAANQTTASKDEAKKGRKPKDNRVRLQLLYKPPFKFSVKLGRNKNEVSSHLIRDKRPEAVKQRTELFVRADRIRAKTANANANNVSPSKGNKSPIKTRDDEPKEKDKEKEIRPSKTEYKRSISAPQPEPLYQNLQIEANSSEEKKTCQGIEEPHYANVTEAKAADRRLSASGMENGKLRTSPNTGSIKTSTDATDPRSMSKPRSSSTHRINSINDDSVNKSREMSVKKQRSDESDRKSANARKGSEGELKMNNMQQSRLRSGGTSKPVRLKCSYDLESAMVMTPSVTTKTSKRNHSQTPQETDRSKEWRSNVRRSMSNSTTQKESDKFKRFSLQHVDMRVPRASQEKLNVSRTISRDLGDAAFTIAHQSELTSEIPSDLEVLLSEVENRN